MTATLRHLIRRTITAARTITQALVSAIRGHQFRLIADLYRAIDNGAAVVIGYTRSDGEQSTRTIEPRALTLSAAGHVLVRGFDRRDGEDTTFRVDRIAHHQPAARPAEQGVTVNAAIRTADPNAVEHGIIRDLDQAWTNLLSLEAKFADGRFHSWEDKQNSYGYMTTAQRTIAARRADLDRYRADRAAFDARVERLAQAATTVGDPVLAAVTYLVYGPAALAA